MTRYVTMVLTGAEARALLVLANEGAEGLLTDSAAARAYLGSPQAVASAVRALELLREAARSPGKENPFPNNIG